MEKDVNVEDKENDLNGNTQAMLPSPESLHVSLTRSIPYFLHWNS